MDILPVMASVKAVKSRFYFTFVDAQARRCVTLTQMQVQTEVILAICGQSVGFSCYKIMWKYKLYCVSFDLSNADLVSPICFNNNSVLREFYRHGSFFKFIWSARFDYRKASIIQNWSSSRILFNHKLQPNCRFATDTTPEFLWQLEKSYYII